MKKALNTEAVLVLLLPAFLTAAASAVQAFAAGEDTRGIISAGLAALIGAGQVLARSQVYSARTHRRALAEKRKAVTQQGPGGLV